MKLNRFLMLTISGLAFSGILTAQAVSVPSTPAPTTSFTPEQTKAIQQIVHDYLLNNPEILLRVSEKLRKNMEQKAQQQTLQSIQANKQKLFHDASNPVAGNPHGNKILVEFFDYQCPHCKSVNKAIQALISKNPDLKVIFKELPILGENSMLASKAALAANMQGKYLPLHDAMLAENEQLTEAKIMELAKKADINTDQLKRDMDSPAVMQQITANGELARAMDLAGTPAFIITDNKEKQFEFIPGETTEQTLQDKLNQLK